MQHRVSSIILALLGLMPGCSHDPPTITPPPSTGLDIRGVVRRDGEMLEGAAVLVGQSLTYDSDDGIPGPHRTHALPPPGEAHDFFTDPHGGESDEGVPPRAAIRRSGPGGFFLFPGVTLVRTASQYDIAVRDDSDPVPSFTHFLGIAANDRQYTVAGESLRKAWSCHVRVHLADLPPNAKAFYVASGSVIRLRDDDDGGGFTFFWNTSYQTSIELQALVYLEDPATKLPRAYLGGARRTLLAMGGRDEEWVPTLEPIGVSTMELALLPKDGARGSVFVDTGNGSNAREIGRLNDVSSRVVLPHFENVRYTLRAERAAGGATSTIVRHFSRVPPKVEATFPPAASLMGDLRPGSSIPRDTWFRWTAKGIARLRVDAGRLGRIDILTSRGAARLPVESLALLGLTLPPKTPVNVSILRVPDFGSIDAATDSAGFAYQDRDRSESFALPLVLQ
ncbi:hypothetical protein [Pendulispora albinea]|uniref:Lipoprotein n=1 Tax=Pendulispora albinea TaxID=2741071 RepID=A0ABZ2LPF4_9BACT